MKHYSRISKIKHRAENIAQRRFLACFSSSSASSSKSLDSHRLIDLAKFILLSAATCTHAKQAFNVHQKGRARYSIDKCEEYLHLFQGLISH